MKDMAIKAKIVDGRVETIATVANANGFSKVIIASLCMEMSLDHTSTLIDVPKVKALWNDKDVPAWKRAAIGMTFGGVCISAKDLPKAVRDLKEFISSSPRVDMINNLTDVADALGMAAERGDVEFVTMSQQEDRQWDLYRKLEEIG